MIGNYEGTCLCQMTLSLLYLSDHSGFSITLNMELWVPLFYYSGLPFFLRNLAKLHRLLLFEKNGFGMAVFRILMRTLPLQISKFKPLSCNEFVPIHT